VTLPGQGVFLLGETSKTVLEGRIYELVVPMIDGRRTQAEIADQLSERLSGPEVHLALRRLEKAGHIEEADAGPFPGAAFFGALGMAGAGQRVGRRTVALRFLGLANGLAGLEGAFAGLGIRIVAEGDVADLTVVLADDTLHPGLMEWNRSCHEARLPWLLAKPSGLVVTCGPLVVPGQSACWECLAQRLRANRETETYLQEKLGLPAPPPVPDVGTAATRMMAAGWIATEVARHLAAEEGTEEPSQLLALDLVARTLVSHPVTRRPQCAVCGDLPSLRRAEGIRVSLSEPGPALSTDGGLRGATPTATFERLAHHVSSVTGAVTLLEPSFRCPEGVIQTWAAGHNLAQRTRNTASLRRNLRMRAGGKGVSFEQARASALCEALERYSSVYRGEEEPRRRARLADLGSAAVHPRATFLFSERQLRERNAWNARESHFNYAPLPFDEAAEVDWTPVWSLTRQEFRLLPTAACYFSYPNRPDEVFCVADSNGNAAGNTIEEAVLGGLLELVERDAVAIWWYSRSRVPGVDVDSLDDPHLAKLRNYLARRGRSFWLLDVTSDIGIPVVVALSERVAPPTGRVFYGFGAHLDVRIAARRAATELNQMLAWVLDEDGTERDPGVEDIDTRLWLEKASTVTEPYLLPDPDRGAHRIHDFPDVQDAGIGKALGRARKLVEETGQEVLVLDLTRPDIGLPVVKVFSPGLRHIWARFAPGRLYDVPVALGRRSVPLTEDDLNPFQIFL
jgi:oxazoline/thiazoline synthase